MTASRWQLLETLVRMENRWATVVGERLADETGQNITYWRVERSDSVIVVPIHQGMIILPKARYRHGAGGPTADFPGGRHEAQPEAEETARQILQRELDVAPEHVDALHPLNLGGWLVDSSFSNQKVFVFEARISAAISLDPELLESRQPADAGGARAILAKLTCLQCRCALLEWLARQDARHGG